MCTNFKKTLHFYVNDAERQRYSYDKQCWMRGFLTLFVRFSAGSELGQTEVVVEIEYCRPAKGGFSETAGYAGAAAVCT